MNKSSMKSGNRIDAVWQELSSESDSSLTKEQAQQVMERLSLYPAQSPTSAETARLAASLCRKWETEDIEDVERTSITNGIYFFRFLTVPYRAMRMMKSHVRILSWPFLLFSLLLLLTGGIAEAVFREFEIVHPFIFAVSLLSALSVAYAFRSFGTPMFELEMTFPITPLQLVFGRLSIIIVYHFVAAAVISVFLPGAAVLTWDYIVSWLIPLGFTSFAALVGILYFGFSAGIIVPLFIWGVQLAVNKDLGALYVFSGYSSELWLESKWIGVVLTLLLVLLSFFKINRLQQQLGGPAA